MLIFDRDRLVARLEPVSNADIPDADRIKDLVRAGIALAPRRRLDLGAFLALERPVLPPGVRSADVVAQERDGR